MNQIDTYITACLEKNIPLETIKSNLLVAGWKSEDIQSSVSKYEPKTIKDVVVHPTADISRTFFIDPSSLLLRLGLAFVFTFAAISLSLNPSEGMHYLPSFITAIMPAKLFLTVFGIYEIILSLWLLWGKKSKYAGFLAAITLLGITALNFSSFSILFRNVAIIFAALSLALMPEKKKNKQEGH